MESLGYRFFSGGDTAVLLERGTKFWGADLLRSMGMFASPSGSVIASGCSRPVTDSGIKPLYYSLDRSRLRFASSLPALLGGARHASDLDPQALNFYSNFHAVVPAPHTLLEWREGFGRRRPGQRASTSTAAASSAPGGRWTTAHARTSARAGRSTTGRSASSTASFREAVAIRQRATPARSACCSPAGPIRACWWARCTKPGWTTR
ncbi:hypothetical protein ACPA9J_30575 [Pseudomonas aeruginosa]